jgi:hypothetical protein
MFPASPTEATQVATLPGKSFLKIHAKIYKNAAAAYTNVVIDKILELFILSSRYIKLSGC